MKRPISTTMLLLLLLIITAGAASIKDILVPVRTPRQDSLGSSRYGASRLDQPNRGIKPEESPDATGPTSGLNVDKRCIRCDPYYDYRYPYDFYKPRYYDDYYDRPRYRDWDYDDRRYYDRPYDRYSNRDRYYGRDYGRDFDRDYYDRRPSYYDRRPYYEDRDRYDDRGGFRPWDQTTRGSSGWDSSGRGYYFATGKPEYGGGGGGGNGYASGWGYSGGRDDDYYDRDRDRGSGYGGRDPYDGYRGTSYLYGRPSSTTTDAPSSGSDGSDNNGGQNGSG